MKKKIENKKTIATVRVQTDMEKPVEIELLAESIKAVADNLQKVTDGPLTKRAVAILLHDVIPARHRVTVTDIITVLNWLPAIRSHIRTKK